MRTYQQLELDIFGICCIVEPPPCPGLQLPDELLFEPHDAASVGGAAAELGEVRAGAVRLVQRPHVRHHHPLRRPSLQLQHVRNLVPAEPREPEDQSEVSIEVT